jgi:serine/threonine protein phosphatase PrpC
MPLVLTAAHHTATGLREKNEDFASFVTPSGSITPTRGMIAAIADGVSGSSGGQEAATHSVRALLSDYYTLSDNVPIAEALAQVIMAINSHVHQWGREVNEQGGMATTLTALVVCDRRYYFAHVGDSRLYLLRDGKLKQLTIDHVHHQPERRHVLTRAIGLDAQVEIDHDAGELQQGDIFLLASDGVWSALPEGDIEWHLSTLAEDPPKPDYTAKLLVDAALAHGSKDNATALVLRVLELPKIHWWRRLSYRKMLVTVLLALSLPVIGLWVFR